METLRWDEFIREITALPTPALTEDALYGLVARLAIDSALLAPHIHFKATGYSRNVLYRDERFEAICLCWEPGQTSSVHNHGGSYGVIYVYEGALQVDTFRRVDDGSQPGEADLAAMVTLHAPAGALMLDRVGSIHKLSNPHHETRRRTVSLHFYAGPLDTMEVFDPATRHVRSVPLQGEPMADIMAAYI